MTPERRQALQSLRAQLEEFGDMMGEWWVQSCNARRESITLTIKWDKDVDPMQGGRIANLFGQAPEKLAGVIRLWLEEDSGRETKEPTA